MTNEEKISKALELILRFGGFEGDHHRAWTIDQTVRILTGDGYEQWVKDAKELDEDPSAYDWEEGIAP